MAEKRGCGFDSLVRDCYRSGGYVFAPSPATLQDRHAITRIARLASNENPDPPSPRAIEMAVAALSQANRYPDEHVTGLVRALREYHGPYNFVVGVGMDGVIETILRTLVAAGDRVVVSTPTFSFYRLAAIGQGAEVREVLRRKDFSVDITRFLKEAQAAKVAFLCSPNNPTGTVTSCSEVEEILGAMEGVLFLDNAYVEFCYEDYRPLMKKYDNLIIGRTMSKAFSLAGLRVGYAFVPDWIVPCYSRAATPFSLNSVSAAAAIGALQDPAHVARARDRVFGLRKMVTERCRFPVTPSGANFVLVDVSPRTGREVSEELATKGVLVRSCESFPGLGDQYIRVSIGEEWEMELFISEINRL
ncbi:MAG: histidinol-phosphate transaminase [Methanolinea sp.]|nr:histidinol-phosphate transaminase [Methanolinea sp.]